MSSSISRSGRRQSIEEAVQGARNDLFTKFEEDRLFGSPALYMQSVDSQLLAPAAGGEAGAKAVQQLPAPPIPARSTLDLLLQNFYDLSEPQGLRDAVEAILRGVHRLAASAVKGQTARLRPGPRLHLPAGTRANIWSL